MSTPKYVALFFSLSLSAALPAFTPSVSSEPRSGSDPSARFEPQAGQGRQGVSPQQTACCPQERRAVHELARVAFEDGRLSPRENRILECHIATSAESRHASRHSRLSRYLKLHDEYGRF